MLHTFVHFPKGPFSQKLQQLQLVPTAGVVAHTNLAPHLNNAIWQHQHVGMKQVKPQHR
jgi:hypothetical protein